MGLFDFLDFFKDSGKVSSNSVKNQVLTTEEIEKFKAVKNSAERERLIKRFPFVLPYVLNTWSEDANIDKIVKIGIKQMPENITKLGKGNVVPTPELVNYALVQKPAVVFDMNDDLKAMISRESFVEAFAKNPEICASKAPVLDKYISRTFKVTKKGKEKIINYRSKIRTECLKAIRIAMGVSKVHKGYDDFAVEIANELKANKALDHFKTKDKMSTQLATVVNSLIKNQDVRIYAMPVDVWKLNNYKTLYLAVKESVKKGSKIDGILEFIPFDLLPEKVTRKVVGVALAKDPTIWAELEQYNLEYLKDNPYIQYITYNACKKLNRMDIIENELSDKEKQVAESKIKGVLKRKQNKALKASKAKLPNKVFTVDAQQAKNVATTEDELKM